MIVDQACGSHAPEGKTVFSEMLEEALKYHGGSMKKARQEISEFMDGVKEALSEAEREFFIEKSGAFICDGYSVEEADAEALDMAIKTRPSQSAAKRRRRSSELEGLREFARREWKWQTGTTKSVCI